jgi:hypothetical protein
MRRTCASLSVRRLRAQTMPVGGVSADGDRHRTSAIASATWSGRAGQEYGEPAPRTSALFRHTSPGFGAVQCVTDQEPHAAVPVIGARR